MSGSELCIKTGNKVSSLHWDETTTYPTEQLFHEEIGNIPSYFLHYQKLLVHGILLHLKKNMVWLTIFTRHIPNKMPNISEIDEDFFFYYCTCRKLPAIGNYCQVYITYTNPVKLELHLKVFTLMWPYLCKLWTAHKQFLRSKNNRKNCLVLIFTWNGL